MANEKRLIDANTLTDAVEHIYWYHISLQGTLVKGANSQLHTPLYKADDIYSAIKDAPTVDAVEVCTQEIIAYIDKAFDRKHGDSYWIDEQGKKHTADVGYGGEWWENCMKPELVRVFANCGAKMDGDWDG